MSNLRFLSLVCLHTFAAMSEVVVVNLVGRLKDDDEPLFTSGSGDKLIAYYHLDEAAVVSDTVTQVNVLLGDVTFEIEYAPDRWEICSHGCYHYEVSTHVDGAGGAPTEVMLVLNGHESDAGFLPTSAALYRKAE